MEVDITSIWIAPDRQRSDFGDITALAESIAARGLINPITVIEEPDLAGARYKLLAGERRLRALHSLNWTKVPVRLFSDLSPTEQRVVELHENLRRHNLSWQEEAKAVADLYRIVGNTVSVVAFASQIGLPQSLCYKYLRLADLVAEETPTYDPKIATASSASAAEAIVKRRDDRKKAARTAEMLDSVRSVIDPSFDPKAHANEPFINEDFVSFADNYNGPSFSFIHCDFPYGISYEGSFNAGARPDQLYEDSPEIYWNLVRALTRNYHKLFSPQCHLMMWFDHRFREETISYITNNTPLELAMPYPLVWIKSDNAGNIGDFTHAPRNVCEFALLFSGNNRTLVNFKSSAISAPTDRSKREHLSLKPEPVLRHFFSMFIDEHTSVLDPTAGSGSSIRVATEFKAKRVLGVEIDPEIYETACTFYRTKLP